MWKIIVEALVGWSLPLVVMGDFNQTIHIEDKWSRSKSYLQGAESLKDFVLRFRLKDIDNF